MQSKPYWKPKNIQNFNISNFQKKIEKKYDLKFSDYSELHKFSVAHRAIFWEEVSDFCEVTWQKASSQTLKEAEQMVDDQWFLEGMLNYAENILKHRSSKIAIEAVKENNEFSQISYEELYLQVAKLQNFLINKGIKKGDRVAGFLPNCAEAIVAMLATTSLGAIWTSTSPDFGFEGVVDRFGQVEAKILFTANAYHYNGRVHSCLGKVSKIISGISSIEHTVIIPFVDDFSTQHDQLKAHKTSLWSESLDNSNSEVTFTPVEFNHPLYILYSSGTTGKPKCIVHGTGGILLQHKKELVLHSDVNPDDKLFYFTTCGWMMWNWMVSTLTIGATAVVYDGSPFYPDGTRLLNIVDDNNITHFGTSAKWISAVEKANIIPNLNYQYKKLRTIFSTGSPLMPESYDYVYNHWKSDVCLSSISGGTDICSCFALGNPALPVYQGELQCIGLGMDVKTLGEDGNEIHNQAGELACLSSFPAMPVGFWRDPNKEKYKSAYFDQFENIWCHGDLVEITEHGGLIIYGRSDATLNPGGVRIGTAEIYRQVEQLDEVIESIAVGQTWKDDVRIVLFVVLQDNVSLNEDMITKIKNKVRLNTTPRHVPSKVLQVLEIPKTLSGKIVELAVKKTIHGQEVNNTDALSNPEALQQYANRDELNS